MEDEEASEEEVTCTELLPGIPNSITVHNISPCLRWTTLHTLTSVSRGWQESVRRHEIYNARVRSHSTDELAVIKYSSAHANYPDHINDIALYCVKNKVCYQIPAFAIAGSEFPKACKCVTLDGKIYILGGLSSNSSDLSSNEVYVLDLAGQRPWKRCANMLVRRHKFGCGVISGKIYVFGGVTLRRPRDEAEDYDPDLDGWMSITPRDEAELYDPKVDGWTAIKPMTRARFWHKVGTVGDELLLYGGISINPVWQPGPGDTNSSILSDNIIADNLEIYNPLQDTWRILPDGPWRDSPHETLFMSEGKLYSMTASSMFVFDFENKSKTLLQSCSYAIEGLQAVPEFGPVAIVPLDGELLAIFQYRVEHNPILLPYFGAARNRQSYRLSAPGLLRSRGFGFEGNPLVWERAEWSLSLEFVTSAFIVPLRL